MFVSPINVLKIQQELKEYQDLCRQYNYSPAKKEFDEIVKFILLYSGNGIYESTKLEENVSDYLFENFQFKLNEAFEAGDDTASTAVGLAGDVGKGAVGLAAVGAEKIGTWITYFWKKGKVKKFADKPFQMSNKLLDEYGQIYKLKVKKAELEGKKEMPKADFPGYLD
jgi:hypothetical protein